MSKEVKGIIKLQIPAGQANPSPPVGPALGQKGANIMDFCKAFNERTADLEKGMPVPVLITVYMDRSFDFITKYPPASYLVMKAAGIKAGSKETGKVFVGKVTREQLRKIAEVKMVDMNASTIEAAVSMLAGTAVSMGIEVEGE